MRRNYTIILSVMGIIASFYLGFIIGHNFVQSSRIISKNVSSPEKIYVKRKELTFPVVAVTSEGEGVLEHVKLEVVPGKGRLFMQINPFVEPDTQYSFETAVKVASKLAGVDYKKYDFIIKFNSNATLVGGPSAGAAIALAVYCALTNRTFPRNIAITGTINPDGTIGEVGGVFEKALAAAKAGKKYFFVPKGQSIVYRYEKIEKRREVAPGFVFVQIEYKPVPLNLSEYFENEYGMKVIEISTLKDLINYINKIEG